MSKLSDGLDEPSVNDIPDAELLARAVKNARTRTGRSSAKYPRWVGVMDAFGLGSTYAMQLCRRYGLEPDEQVKR